MNAAPRRWRAVLLICSLALALAAAESECEASSEPPRRVITAAAEPTRTPEASPAEATKQETISAIVPGMPGIVRELRVASTSRNSITLAWEPPRNADTVAVSHYEVTVDIAFAPDDRHTVVGTQFIEEGLDSARTRDYRVRAISETGDEGLELTISGTTDSPPTVQEILAKSTATSRATPRVTPGTTEPPQTPTVTTTPEPTPDEGPVTHTVRPGEWLASIAANYGIGLQPLLDANGLDASAVIHPGQVLTIPGGQPSPTPGPTPSPTPGPTPQGPQPASQSELESLTRRYQWESDICTGVAESYGYPPGHPDHIPYWNVCVLLALGEDFLADWCERYGLSRLHARPVGDYAPGPRAISHPADPAADRVWWCE
ncbi:MAG: LysM peptidoglycan-binding domain-containing protein [Gammaproteobacteria bacterium]|nr:LysM peptidoglycan-binding domain-containing protein [Gammaproteobacteria bacterium]